MGGCETRALQTWRLFPMTVSPSCVHSYLPPHILLSKISSPSLFYLVYPLYASGTPQLCQHSPRRPSKRTQGSRHLQSPPPISISNTCSTRMATSDVSSSLQLQQIVVPAVGLWGPPIGLSRSAARPRIPSCPRSRFRAPAVEHRMMTRARFGSKAGSGSIQSW